MQLGICGCWIELFEFAVPYPWNRHPWSLESLISFMVCNTKRKSLESLKVWQSHTKNPWRKAWQHHEFPEYLPRIGSGSTAHVRSLAEKKQHVWSETLEIWNAWDSTVVSGAQLDGSLSWSNIAQKDNDFWVVVRAPVINRWEWWYWEKLRPMIEKFQNKMTQKRREELKDRNCRLWNVLNIFKTVERTSKKRKTSRSWSEISTTERCW